jgi:hypothetical protein
MTALLSISPETANSKALSLVTWLSDRAVQGLGPLIAADSLAAIYLADRRFSDDSERVKALIRRESVKNFSTGFVTGLGGLALMPAAVPASLGAGWIVQARLAAAIAAIHGYEVREDRVLTLVALSLIGNAAKDELKRIGIRLGQQLAVHAIRQIPSRVLVEINKAVGFRLLSRTGNAGMFRLAGLGSVAGGLVGGAVDGMACRTVGRVADSIFAPVSV